MVCCLETTAGDTEELNSEEQHWYEKNRYKLEVN